MSKKDINREFETWSEKDKEYKRIGNYIKYYQLKKTTKRKYRQENYKKIHGEEFVDCTESDEKGDFVEDEE